MSSHNSRPLCTRLVLSFVSSTLSVACNVQAQCPGQAWQAMGDVPGVFGRVHAVVEWDPDGAGPLPSLLVAGGTIHAAGSRLVNNIATWDGAAWSTLGNGLPLT